MHRPLELDNPFWIFSSSVYRGFNGVSEACLAVQDVLGGDVNLLLFCAWCGIARGAKLSEAQIAALERCVEDWNGEVIGPLRAARQAVKTAAGQAPAIGQFRKEVLAVELRAEQVAHAMLYAQAADLETGARLAETAAVNVALYMTRLERATGKPPSAVSVEPLIEAASAFVV